MTLQQSYIESAMNAGDEILSPALSRGLDDQLAIVDEHESLTYRQLNQRANQFGNALRSHGVQPEERVMFLLEDSADMVAAYIGTMRIGAVAIAYNRKAVQRDLIFTINESRAQLLFIEADFVDTAIELIPQIHHPFKLVVRNGEMDGQLSTQALLANSSQELDSTPMSPDDMAFWIYTSGTTGKPKAAVHLQHDLIGSDLHLRENLKVQPGEKILCTSKFFFAYPLAHGMFAGLRCGATLILFDGWPTPERTGALVEKHHPDLLFSVPTLYQKLLDDGVAGSPAFRTIRCCVSAGEQLPKTLYNDWQQLTGKPIYEGIGTTETLVLYIVNSPEAHRPGASGRVVPWAEVRLINEIGDPINTPDTPGVAWLRMPSICDRYWNRQDMTRQAFNGVWYRTGDIFSFDAEGWWYHQGRADHMLKISGQWVSPSEIEYCALSVPSVSEAAVVEAPRDDGPSRIVLFLRPQHAGVDEQAMTQQVREALRNQLAHFKCPQDVRIIDEVPRTATGKIQKYKLQQLLEETTPAS
ncbi:benzoate-CoA ligase family protein [Sedimenticola selenatireducens]|uniref:Benzoate-CoA ligase family protein n=1 Tax=Sedimenticola selenatireducens TaxID=191960 RepID=A0A2N6CS88_9GAMM|nr:benzoate-CoA ligase family protein [Sedimenticola selenatireducens]PLX59953.1 MAG: benzoate-CoA ligase family protein [Sedimenticola selenatireducens]